jgi:dynactin-5
MSEEDPYIKTTTHNYISRKAVIEGPRQVELKGRSVIQDAVKIRGDVGIVRVGRYVWIAENTELEPAPLATGGEKRVPMMIGNHTRIGQHCHIQAAAVGSLVNVGDNVKIGKRCIIKDCCVIASNVVLGDDTVVPPFTRVANDGTSSRLKMSELPPSMTIELQDKAMDQYQEFTNLQRVR